MGIDKLRSNGVVKWPRYIQFYRATKFITSYRVYSIWTIIKDVYYYFKSSLFLYVSHESRAIDKTLIKSI